MHITQYYEILECSWDACYFSQEFLFSLAYILKLANFLAARGSHMSKCWPIGYKQKCCLGAFSKFLQKITNMCLCFFSFFFSPSCWLQHGCNGWYSILEHESPYQHWSAYITSGHLNNVNSYFIRNNKKYIHSCFPYFCNSQWSQIPTKTMKRKSTMSQVNR